MDYFFKIRFYLISKFFLTNFVTFTKYYIIGDEYYELMKRLWKDSYKETGKEHRLI
jgi:hypothetical protein